MDFSFYWKMSDKVSVLIFFFLLKATGAAILKIASPHIMWLTMLQIGVVVVRIIMAR